MPEVTTAPAAEAAPKKPAVKKAPAEKTAPKPKVKAVSTESVNSDKPTREPVWNTRRVAVVKAMRALGATSGAAAVTAAQIAKRAGKPDGVNLSERVDLVKIILDVYRPAELLHNGFVKSVRLEGERELRYYLTAKGVKTEFPQKKTKAKEPGRHGDAG